MPEFSSRTSKFGRVLRLAAFVLPFISPIPQRAWCAPDLRCRGKAPSTPLNSNLSGRFSFTRLQLRGDLGINFGARPTDRPNASFDLLGEQAGIHVGVDAGSASACPSLDFGQFDDGGGWDVVVHYRNSYALIGAQWTLRLSNLGMLPLFDCR